MENQVPSVRKGPITGQDNGKNAFISALKIYSSADFFLAVWLPATRQVDLMGCPTVKMGPEAGAEPGAGTGTGTGKSSCVRKALLNTITARPGVAEFSDRSFAVLKK